VTPAVVGSSGGSSDRQKWQAAVTGSSVRLQGQAAFAVGSGRLQRQAARWQPHNQDILCGIFSKNQLLKGAFASSIVKEISDSRLC
jgi:hypothetical protein